jgi:hypothetical protein
MVTVIEPLYKAKDQITFGWVQEPGNVAVSYKMYVSLVSEPTTMTLLYSDISIQVSRQSPTIGKVTQVAQIADVRTALSLPATADFSNKVLYFTLTYVNSVGATSALADSTVVEVTPVGILPKKYMKDDPAYNKHIFGFSDSDQRWAKLMATSSGALITSGSGFYADNVVNEYTWDGTSMATMKSYPSDATVAGSPAKLTTYTYTGGFLTKTVTVDSTV